MKSFKVCTLGLVALALSIGQAGAWFVTGRVLCPNGTAYANVAVNVAGPTTCNGLFVRTVTTDADGEYFLWLNDCESTLTVSLDASTLPAGATIQSPPGGTFTFTTTEADPSEVVDFIVDSSHCRGACWFTGGGAKVDPVLDIPVAQKGKWISFGGNVNPGCSPTAGEGGNWNHIDRLANLHFQGRAITVLECGNVTPPPPPGSTSPVTPFNYIIWTGVGTLKGIQGNKVNLPVYFNARTEDRNEPGTKGSNAGSGIDRYYLHVFTNPSNPAGSTVLLVNGVANPLDVVPVEIDDGNFQLHISSCDNPPTF
jgi:hypothetical protein